MTNPFADQADIPNREGAWAQRAEADLPTRRHQEEIERALAHGLEAAPTINDRTLSTFARGELPHFAGERGTFLKSPFIEDVHDVSDAEVAVFGVPLDAGATPNAPATNLVRIGIGGWQAPRPGVQVGRQRGTTVITVGDIERRCGKDRRNRHKAATRKRTVWGPFAE